MKMDLKGLLTDDDEQVRQRLTILLSREQAHVTAVSDGQQAIERLRHARYPFDLVLSDVEMPRVDGWDLLAWVQEHDATLPVVLMSAGLPMSFIQTARQGSTCGATPKPFRQQWFRELLACLFDPARHHQRRDFYCPLMGIIWITATCAAVGGFADPFSMISRHRTNACAAMISSRSWGVNPMTSLPLAFFTGFAILTLGATAASAADPFSDADKAFVAKVSQGGMYEVELGKLAEIKATTQDLKDQATTEEHDHQLVGGKLKAIMEANGMTFPTALNAEFQARLEKMSALSADKFDAAYVEDMKKIHDADGAAFAKEAKGGTNTDLKAFAAETYRIVQRHLGELGAKVN